MKNVGLNFNSNNSEVLKELLKIKAEKENANILDLYGVKCGDDETGEELIDKAHPGKTNFMPSYIENGGDDNINTIKNQNEQQQRDFEAAMRMPNGSMSRKLATAQMLSEEIYLIAEEMDLRGEVEISKFADDLLNRLNKYALVPLAPLAIGGIAVASLVPLIGAWWKMSNDTINYGFNKNLIELNSLVEKYEEELESLGEKDQIITDILDNIKTTSSLIYQTRERYIDNTKSDIDNLRYFYQTLKPKYETFKEYKKNDNLNDPAVKAKTKLSQAEITSVSKIKERLAIASNRYVKYCNKTKENLQKILKVMQLQVDATQNISQTGDNALTRGYKSISNMLGGNIGQQVVGGIKQIIAQIDSEQKRDKAKQDYILDNLQEVLAVENTQEEIGIDSNLGGDSSPNL